MFSLRVARLVSLSLVACSARTLDSDSATAGTSEGSSADPSTSSPPGTSVSPPNPTAPTSADPTASTVETSMSPPDPTTSDVTTTFDPSGTTAFPPPKFDMNLDPPPTVLPSFQGCTLPPPAGTKVVGTTALGPFTSTRAFFAEVEINFEVVGARLLLVDDAADAAAVLAEIQKIGVLQTGPAAMIEPGLPFEDHWKGEEMLSAAVVLDGQQTEVGIKLTVTGEAGTWDAFDPADPPRLLGSVAPTQDGIVLLGEFDAVYCDKIRVSVIAE